MKLKYLLKSVTPALLTLSFIGFSQSSIASGKYALEVARFKILSTVDTSVFKKLDKDVEQNFTSQQSGSIKRLSGVNDNGEYIVLAYWETKEDADRSVEVFMEDPSVKTFASSIDFPTLKSISYISDNKFTSDKSKYIEVSTYKMKKDDQEGVFDNANEMASDFFAKSTGFLSRVNGFNSKGERIQVTYWDDKSNFDKAKKSFIKSPVYTKIMKMEQRPPVKFEYYHTLND